MSDASRILTSVDLTLPVEPNDLAEAIDAFTSCAAACTACADACLGEDDVADQRACITACSNCADVCAATLAVLSRQTAYDARITRAVLTACVEVCAACAEECERHAEHGMEHCRVCAEACRACEEACRALL
jgi:hypothetical protein